MEETPATEKTSLYDRYPLLNARPHSTTPYQRMRWQQENVKENIIGYAVGLASENTKRAAYLTTTGELTNDERKAAVLPKEKAAELMAGMLESDKLVDWIRKPMWRIAFLVPSASTLPLTFCTFQGY